MRYADGSEVLEGDVVTYDMEPAVVEEVIDTPEILQASGLDEPGVRLSGRSSSQTTVRRLASSRSSSSGCGPVGVGPCCFPSR